MPFVLCGCHLLTCDRCMYNTCHTQHSMFKVAEKTYPLWAKASQVWRRESQMTVCVLSLGASEPAASSLLPPAFVGLLLGKGENRVECLMSVPGSYESRNKIQLSWYVRYVLPAFPVKNTGIKNKTGFGKRHQGRRNSLCFGRRAWNLLVSGSHNKREYLSKSHQNITAL